MYHSREDLEAESVVLKEKCEADSELYDVYLSKIIDDMVNDEDKKLYKDTLEISKLRPSVSKLKLSMSK